MSLLLSICIPTYNRVDKLIPHIYEILKCKSPYYEIVVVDNCSTDTTIDELNKINDKHIRIVKHPKSVGGKASGVIALEQSSAKYSLLLLDKDRLDGDYLYSFLDVLENDDFALGYCQLNKESNESNTIIEASIESLLQVGFSGMHPSGHFFKTSLYRSKECVKDSLRYDFGFHIDIIQGYMSQDGRALIYRRPLVFTETREECSKIKSYSFINKRDCFFNYRGRAFQYMQYLKHSQLLIKDKDSAFFVFFQLYEKGLHEATLGYRDLMRDSIICTHYHVEPEKVSTIKMIYASFYYSIYIYRSLWNFYNLKFIFKSMYINIYNIKSILRNA